MAFTVELGTFIFFIVFPVATFLFVLTVKQWNIGKYILFSILGIFGFILLAGLALMMFAGYDVVQSSVQSSYAQTAVERDGGGVIVGNTTTIVPEITKTVPIINSFQTIWGWIFFSMAIIFGLLTLYVMATGGLP